MKDINCGFQHKGWPLRGNCEPTMLGLILGAAGSHSNGGALGIVGGNVANKTLRYLAKK